MKNPSFEELIKHCDLVSDSIGCKYFKKGYEEYLTFSKKPQEQLNEIEEVSSNKNTGNLFTLLFGRSDESKLSLPSHISERISDIVFKNSQCLCQGTGTCTRGGCIKNKNSPLAEVQNPLPRIKVF